MCEKSQSGFDAEKCPDMIQFLKDSGCALRKTACGRGGMVAGGAR